MFRNLIRWLFRRTPKRPKNAFVDDGTLHAEMAGNNTLFDGDVEVTRDPVDLRRSFSVAFWFRGGPDA